MGLDVFFINIMAVVGRRKRDAQLLAHARALVYRLLRWYSVVLKLQEKISLRKFLIAEGRFAGLLIHPSGEITPHLASQAGASGEMIPSLYPGALQNPPSAYNKASTNPLDTIFIRFCILHYFPPAGLNDNTGLPCSRSPGQNRDPGAT